MTFYKEFQLKCNCEKKKDLRWDSINSFYFCDECNKSFNEDDFNNHL
jgi:hypothetical protein